VTLALTASAGPNEVLTCDSNESGLDQEQGALVVGPLDAAAGGGGLLNMDMCFSLSVSVDPAVRTRSGVW
jgi:hypothetical protein